MVSLSFVHLSGWRLSRCQRHFQEASRFSSLGRYVPKCHPDGRYKDVQCYGSTCFCVGSNGLDLGLNRTLLPQVPTCPPTPGKTFTLPFLHREVQNSFFTWRMWNQYSLFIWILAMFQFLDSKGIVLA